MKNWKRILLISELYLMVPLFATEPKILKSGDPLTVRMDAKRLQGVDQVIQKEIANQKIPGAVLLIARQGVIVYRKAYGHAQLSPVKEPMTGDKIFDMASLTKPIATATAIMLLVEQGKLGLHDPVTKYLPEFTPFVSLTGDTARAPRIWHLLTHTSGLPAYADTAAIKAQYGCPCPEGVIRTIATTKKIAAPGEKYVYSCLGYITLAEIIKRVAGETIDQFTNKNIFTPLGMYSTGFCPPKEWQPRIVPTEIVHGKPHRGLVHDPLAQLMDGKSGNAGLFSCTDDLAIFCQMLLNGGVYGKGRILAPASVRLMTTVYSEVPNFGRGLGWGINTSYSSIAGDLFSQAAFGHTGFTGTSIVVDPSTETFIILLTNRVHISTKIDIGDLRTKIANIVAGSILD